MTGATDGILVKSGGNRTIVDYKTGRHTSGQDALRPMYEVQLKAYALIANRMGFGPVDQLALVYTEPTTDGDADFFDGARTVDGFRMGFHAKIVTVDLDPAALDPLLSRARIIYDRPTPPSIDDNCDDCANFETLLVASRSWSSTTGEAARPR